MKVEEGKHKFIQAWGALGSSWGINRTMSQIHALLLVTSEPLSAEDIMNALKVSRGNVNMNTRALIDWGLVKKEFIAGERKEYFVAGKDVDEMARQVARVRRKRELEPVIDTLEELKKVKGTDKETKEFKKLIADVDEFGSLADKMMDKFIRSDKNWFLKVLMKAMK